MNAVNNSTIVSDAINAMQEANVAAAQAEARGIILTINGLQDQKAQNAARISALQVELGKVASFEFTVATVLGGDLPTNSNSETITNTIDTLNKERQDGVKLATARITTNITALQANNLDLDKRIAEAQAKLAAVKVETIDQAAVTGSPAQS